MLRNKARLQADRNLYKRFDLYSTPSVLRETREKWRYDGRALAFADLVEKLSNGPQEDEQAEGATPTGCAAKARRFIFYLRRAFSPQPRRKSIEGVPKVSVDHIDVEACLTTRQSVMGQEIDPVSSTTFMGSPSEPPDPDESLESIGQDLSPDPLLQQSILEYEKSMGNGKTYYIFELVLPQGDRDPIETFLSKNQEFKSMTLCENSATMIWMHEVVARVIVVADKSNIETWSPQQMFRKALSDMALTDSILLRQPQDWNPVARRRLSKAVKNLKKLYRRLERHKASRGLTHEGQPNPFITTDTGERDTWEKARELLWIDEEEFNKALEAPDVDTPLTCQVIMAQDKCHGIEEGVTDRVIEEISESWENFAERARRVSSTKMRDSDLNCTSSPSSRNYYFQKSGGRRSETRGNNESREVISGHLEEVKVLLHANNYETSESVTSLEEEHCSGASNKKNEGSMKSQAGINRPSSSTSSHRRPSQRPELPNLNDDLPLLSPRGSSSGWGPSGEDQVQPEIDEIGLFKLGLPRLRHRYPHEMDHGPQLGPLPQSYSEPFPMPPIHGQGQGPQVGPGHEVNPHGGASFIPPADAASLSALHPPPIDQHGLNNQNVAPGAIPPQAPWSHHHRQGSDLTPSRNHSRNNLIGSHGINKSLESLDMVGTSGSSSRTVFQAQAQRPRHSKSHLHSRTRKPSCSSPGLNGFNSS